jgi:hypothetical protein
MRVDTLAAIAEDQAKPVIHMIIARIAMAAIRDGDEKKLQFFMDRLIGVLPKAPEVNFNLNLQEMPTEKVITLARDAIEFLEEEKNL